MIYNDEIELPSFSVDKSNQNHGSQYKQTDSADQNIQPR